MKVITSSSSTKNIQGRASSATQLSEEEAYWNEFIEPKPLSAAQIKAQGESKTAQTKTEGEIKTRLGVLWFVGIVCVILTIIGGMSFIMHPENSKDVWVVIGPILSSSMTGTIAFLTGEKRSAKN